MVPKGRLCGKQATAIPEVELLVPDGGNSGKGSNSTKRQSRFFAAANTSMVVGTEMISYCGAKGDDNVTSGTGLDRSLTGTAGNCAQN